MVKRRTGSSKLELLWRTPGGQLQFFELGREDGDHMTSMPFLGKGNYIWWPHQGDIRSTIYFGLECISV